MLYCLCSKMCKLKIITIDLLHDFKRRSRQMTTHYKSILVAVDGSKEAEYAFRKSLDVAYRNQGSQLNIVNIIDTRHLGPLDKKFAGQVKEQSQQILDRYKARAVAARVENVNIIIKDGSPSAVITKELMKLV